MDKSECTQIPEILLNCLVNMLELNGVLIQEIPLFEHELELAFDDTWIESFLVPSILISSVLFSIVIPVPNSEM